KIRHQHVDLCRTKRSSDVDRLFVGFVDDLTVETTESVTGGPALYVHAERRHVSDRHRVVLARCDRLGQITADLLGIHIERCGELDVADVVTAELHVHQTWHASIRFDITIVVDTLHQRRCAVSDAHNRNPNASVLAHAGSPSFSVCALYGLGFLAAL